MKQKTPGQSLSEYGLIMALVALLCVPALLLLKDSMNESITDMLPSSKTNSPSTVRLPQNGNPPNIPFSSQTGGSVSNLPNVLGSAASIPQPISTAGSNGNSATVLANSSKMLAIAAKYSQISPELSNALIQLGRVGQQMGQSIAKNDRGAADDKWDDFTHAYKQVLSDPDSYAKLSSEDQALIRELTNQSAKLTSDFTGLGYSAYEGLEDHDPQEISANANAAGQVQNNSNQTVQCGQNLKCD